MKTEWTQKRKGWRGKWNEWMKNEVEEVLIYRQGARNRTRENVQEKKKEKRGKPLFSPNSTKSKNFLSLHQGRICKCANAMHHVEIIFYT